MQPPHLDPEDSPPSHDVDREIRIEKMKRELEDLSGGQMMSGQFGEVAPEIEEAFLERACAFEAAPLDTYFNRLVARGVAMEPPDELDDITLNARLWESLRTLAEMRCFVSDTDHLSDCELYTWLWADGLREETPDLAMLGGAWHTSPIGAGTDEDTRIFLTYYASEKEREQWHERFPADPLPKREPVPFQRDENLPQPPDR